VATILVVDDEPDIRLLIRINLERDGHTSVMAANGAEALAAVQESRPDVVLLDVMMPDVDGWTVLERLKSDADPEISGIPVLMLTALDAPIDQVKGGIEGAVRYLTKPIDLDALRVAVEDALQGPEPPKRRKAQQQALEMLARIESNSPPGAASTAPRPRLSAFEHERQPVRAPVALERLAEERVATLTDKQRLMLETVARAPTVIEAAEELAMSRSNVYASLRRISRKLGTGSVSDLLEIVRRGGLPS
jgi:DNA-binding response OmpR family regulator